ncbi:activator of HSP90 ATPase [Dictyobacter vulcani]|uniref:Activator of HSP90 ATPase n=1 Tax=Dictyobacter vulcani TaxID=2607529 RepID=A0A5J4KRW5_9CHLR|nr:SRPBCC domain-containing protein [Dictyobacter vulcani]GER90403.1 activator of HSP90 ATPase [Dictyobacter vulcani]
MTVTQLPSSFDILLLEVDFPASLPQLVFDYWTQPALLQQWWPQAAELVRKVGSAYHLSWPQMNWHLRGHYTTFELAKQLVFTWRWDHEEPEEVGREVKLVFEPLETIGTRLHLSHGPYNDTPEDQELRIEHHLAGWQHFLPRLQQLLALSV